MKGCDVNLQFDTLVGIYFYFFHHILDKYRRYVYASVSDFNASCA